MTNQILEQMLDELESDRVERKQSWTGNVPDKAREAVCAFANDLPNHNQPGILFLGADDRGGVTHLDVTDRLLQTLSDMKTDGKINPPPTLTVERRLLKGAWLAVVTVWPADAPPVRFEGRVWIRIGPRRGIATVQDERVLNEKRRHRDRPFDIHPLQDCPIDELSRIIFENDYLPNAVSADTLAANNRSYEHQLASVGMIASVADPTPTVVGELTIGKSPRTWIPCAYIQFLRIAGAEITDPIIDEQELDGTFDLILRRLDEKLKATLAVSVEFTSGETREIRHSAYPLAALQQIARNAVMHRIYEGTNQPIRMYWFEDRIEISNPGGPFGIVNDENFGLPGFTDYRNPSIASVLKTLGYVQRFGVGIALARKALAENGNPELEFQVKPNTILAIMRKRA